MGDFKVNPKHFTQHRIEAGFSLLEVIASIAIVTVVVVTVLQCMAYCFQISQTAQERWREALSKWNQVQAFRSLRSPLGDPFPVIPQARPMSFLLVESGLENDESCWEVLRAAK